MVLPESCIHGMGFGPFGIWWLGEREVPVGVQELMDMDRTDETTSESDNDSEGSLEDGVEDFEL